MSDQETKPKQFRVRDVIIHVPTGIGKGGTTDCAEDPSRLSCFDGETLVKLTCPPPVEHDKKPPQFGCWKGGFTIKECPGTSVCGFLISEFPCPEGSPSGICDEKISPRVEFMPCDDAISWTECGNTEASLTPHTPVIDTVNTPVVIGKLTSAPDKQTIQNELRHILDVLEQNTLPSTPEEFDAVEQRLHLAIEDLRQRRLQSGQKASE